MTDPTPNSSTSSAAQPKKGGFLSNLLFNIVIPVVILTKFSQDRKRVPRAAGPLGLRFQFQNRWPRSAKKAQYHREKGHLITALTACPFPVLAGSTNLRRRAGLERIGVERHRARAR